MKAFLLAAGFGTRLRPLTETTAKCMVPINGIPLLEYWFRLLQKHRVSEFLINTHHLREQVEEFVKAKAPEYSLKSRIVYEPQLIGSAGTIRENFDFVQEEEDFLILYADNLTNANLTTMVEFHERLKPTLTMGLTHMDKPETRGIAEVDRDGRIVSFVEKPKLPKSDLANAGIYVVSCEIEPYLRDAFDIGFDVLPQLAGKMCGFELNGYHRDIGSLDSLEAANREWPQVKG